MFAQNVATTLFKTVAVEEYTQPARISPNIFMLIVCLETFHSFID